MHCHHGLEHIFLKKATLSAELNHDYWELARKLSADNIVTEEENNQLKKLSFE